MASYPSIFVSSFITILLATASDSVKWKISRNGEIPPNAVKFKYAALTSKNSYYCRARNNTTSSMYTGIIHDTETLCEYTKTKDGLIGYSNEYEILTLDNDGARIKYRYRSYNSPMPKGVVKCVDDSISDCYLGRSIYSDGLCEEEIGKVDAKRKRIYITTSGGMRQCPFFLYLTETPRRDFEER